MDEADKRKALDKNPRRFMKTVAEGGGYSSVGSSSAPLSMVVTSFQVDCSTC